MNTKIIALIALLLCSFWAKADFSPQKHLGINTELDAGSIFSKRPPNPKYVLDAGAYHLITSNEYPFYKPSAEIAVWGKCFKPGISLPMGTLWLQSVADYNLSSPVWRSNTARLNFDFAKVNSPNLFFKPAKFCNGCVAKEANLWEQTLILDK